LAAIEPDPDWPSLWRSHAESPTVAHDEQAAERAAQARLAAQ
jgi:hypothetical protein